MINSNPVFIKPADRLTYAIINVIVVTDKKENPTDTPNKWIVYTLQDADDPQDEPFSQSVMSTALATKYEDAMKEKGVQPVVDATTGRTAYAMSEAQIELLPENLRTITNACRKQVYFLDENGNKIWCYRKWGSSGYHTATVNGVDQRVPHNKGDIVKDKSGVAKLYDSVWLFLSYKTHDGETERPLYAFAKQFAEATRDYIPFQPEQQSAPQQTAQQADPAQQNAPAQQPGQPGTTQAPLQQPPF